MEWVKELVEKQKREGERRRRLRELAACQECLVTADAPNRRDDLFRQIERSVEGYNKLHGQDLHYTFLFARLGDNLCQVTKVVRPLRTLTVSFVKNFIRFDADSPSGHSGRIALVSTELGEVTFFCGEALSSEQVAKLTLEPFLDFEAGGEV